MKCALSTDYAHHKGAAVHFTQHHSYPAEEERRCYATQHASQLRYNQSMVKTLFEPFFPHFCPHLLFNYPAMSLPDTMYCSQQINIPPVLPDILKNFTKAAIRTQPKDLLVWSAAYFSALSKGECLPVKDRLEMNAATQRTDTGLTPGLLKTLHKQLSPRETCSKEEVQKKWKGLCLPVDQLESLLSLGSFGSDIDWMEFFSLGCSALGGTLVSSLKFACEILTEDEEGGAARIPFDTFVKLYTYLAHLDGDMPQQHIDNFLNSLQLQVELQHGMIKPLDFIYQDDIDSTTHASSNFARATSRAE